MRTSLRGIARFRSTRGVALPRRVSSNAEFFFLLLLLPRASQAFQIRFRSPHERARQFMFPARSFKRCHQERVDLAQNILC